MDVDPSASVVDDEQQAAASDDRAGYLTIASGAPRRRSARR